MVTAVHASHNYLCSYLFPYWHKQSNSLKQSRYKTRLFCRYSKSVTFPTLWSNLIQNSTHKLSYHSNTDIWMEVYIEVDAQFDPKDPKVDVNTVTRLLYQIRLQHYVQWHGFCVSHSCSDGRRGGPIEIILTILIFQFFVVGCQRIEKKDTPPAPFYLNLCTREYPMNVGR